MSTRSTLNPIVLVNPTIAVCRIDRILQTAIIA